MKRKQFSMSESIISLGDIDLNVAIREGQGQSIVCLHGLSGNLNSWVPLLSTLPENDFHFVSYDLRGRGHSKKPKFGYGIEKHKEDLNNLLNHLNISNPILLAHSFGCLIAIQYAIANPSKVKALILMDGGGQVSVMKKLQILKVLKPSIERLGKFFPDKATYLQLVKNSPIIPEWNLELERYFEKELQETEMGFVCHMPEYVMEQELKEMGGDIKEINIFINFLLNPFRILFKILRNRNLRYNKIQCPVLILRATEKNLISNDDLLPKYAFERMLRKIPYARGAEIPSNHYGILFYRNTLRDQIIMDFLKNPDEYKPFV